MSDSSQGFGDRFTKGLIDEYAKREYDLGAVPCEDVDGQSSDQSVQEEKLVTQQSPSNEPASLVSDDQEMEKNSRDHPGMETVSSEISHDKK
jgi:hypothetical protein